MAGTNQGIIDPPIDQLLDKVDSKYQLVIYASKRASDQRLLLRPARGQPLRQRGTARRLDRRGQALTIAMHEIHEDKLRLRHAE